MAISILYEPTDPNAANSNLIYTVSGSYVGQPQHSYVCNVFKIGDPASPYAQIKQVANPNGTATFNLNNLVFDALDYKDVWKTPILSGSSFFSSSVPSDTYEFSGGTDPTGSSNWAFQFREQFSTSPTGSLIFTGSVIGVVNTFIGTWDGNDPNDVNITSYEGTAAYNALSYNFPSSSFYTSQGSWNPQLTDDPYKFVGRYKDPLNLPPFTLAYKTVGSQDYDTVSILAGPSLNTPSGTIKAGTKFLIAITGPTPNPQIGYYQSTRQVTGVPALERTNSQYLLHMGLGPANIRDFVNSGQPGSTNNDLVNIANGNYIGYIVYSDTFYFAYFNEKFAYNNYDHATASGGVYRGEYFDKVTANEKLRFAFINRYGVYDYFNCYGALKRSTALQKDMVNLPRVDYSSFNTTYDISRRGVQDYFTDFTDTYSIQTQPLNKPMSKWLEQLFDSPRVFVQQGSEFIPIQITNSQYQHNNNQARNKDFTYTIQFRPAKGREIYSTTPDPCSTTI